jgi:hypothetical protein
MSTCAAASITAVSPIILNLITLWADFCRGLVYKPPLSTGLHLLPCHVHLNESIYVPRDSLYLQRIRTDRKRVELHKPCAELRSLPCVYSISYSFSSNIPQIQSVEGHLFHIAAYPYRRSCPLPYFNFSRTVRVVPGIALLVRIESFTKSLQHQGSAAEVPVSPEGDAP